MHFFFNSTHTRDTLLVRNLGERPFRNNGKAVIVMAISYRRQEGLDFVPGLWPEVQIVAFGMRFVFSLIQRTLRNNTRIRVCEVSRPLSIRCFLEFLIMKTKTNQYSKLTPKKKREKERNSPVETPTRATKPLLCRRRCATCASNLLPFPHLLQNRRDIRLQAAYGCAGVSGHRFFRIHGPLLIVEPRAPPEKGPGSPAPPNRQRSDKSRGLVAS